MVTFTPQYLFKSKNLHNNANPLSDRRACHCGSGGGVCVAEFDAGHYIIFQRDSHRIAFACFAGDACNRRADRAAGACSDTFKENLQIIQSAQTHRCA